MKRRDFLEQWGLSSLKLSAAEFRPADTDRHPAWELYVELLTRINTHALPAEHGDEKTALKSVFNLFHVPRGILRKHGPGSNEPSGARSTTRRVAQRVLRRKHQFAKLAIPALNQIIRPFTAKRHKLHLANAFTDEGQCQTFRAELATLQPRLRHYTQALAAMAGVEDLTGWSRAELTRCGRHWHQTKRTIDTVIT